MTYEWFSLSMPDLDVRTILFDYGDEELDKAVSIRALAYVAREYLRGHGNVGRRRGLLGTRNVLTLEGNDRMWTLGRRLSSPGHP